MRFALLKAGSAGCSIMYRIGAVIVSSKKSICLVNDSYFSLSTITISDLSLLASIAAFLNASSAAFNLSI